MEDKKKLTGGGGDKVTAILTFSFFRFSHFF